jgi:outer membrane receptor protein involved in Fe transport
MKPYRPNPLRVLALALLPSAAPLLHAQATPPPASPPPQPPPAEELVVLDAVTVNTERDRGYIAVDALAGGRVNTPIKLTPASMSSLTRTFLNDLGIQDVREALRWTLNVVPEDPLAGKGFGGQAFHSWSYNFRGAGAGQQGGPGPTRNYFSFFENPDSYNIDRVEFTRGPNSILFGLGTVGGTLSTYTKGPAARPHLRQPGDHRRRQPQPPFRARLQSPGEPALRRPAECALRRPLRLARGR